MNFFKSSKLFKFFVIAALFIACERFCRLQTAGFRWEKIFPDEELALEEKEEISKEFIASLNQPFYFLGSGVQCYTFVSKDQSIVLKLFKHYHLAPSTRWLLKLPSPFQGLFHEIVFQRKKRMKHILKSALIASNKLAEETQVSYMHLKQTTQLPRVLLYDKIHVLHTLDLNHVEFAIQKRGYPLWEVLHACAQKNDQESIQMILSSLFQQISGRLEKGIRNKDVKWDNFGMIDHHVIEWDIGSFAHQHNPSLAKRKKIFLKTAARLKKRFSKELPQFVNDFDAQMQGAYENLR